MLQIAAVVWLPSNQDWLGHCSVLLCALSLCSKLPIVIPSVAVDRLTSVFIVVSIGVDVIGFTLASLWFLPDATSWNGGLDVTFSTVMAQIWWDRFTFVNFPIGCVVGFVLTGINAERVLWAAVRL